MQRLPKTASVGRIDPCFMIITQHWVYMSQYSAFISWCSERDVPVRCCVPLWLTTWTMGAGISVMLLPVMSSERRLCPDNTLSGAGSVCWMVKHFW